MDFNCLDIESAIGFDWDDGNKTKSKIKHNISWDIAEEVFLNNPLLLLKDSKHSQYECRCIAFGSTNSHKLLTIAFTKRDNKIRIISARPMNKKERIYYETNS